MYKTIGCVCACGCVGLSQSLDTSYGHNQRYARARTQKMPKQQTTSLTHFYAFNTLISWELAERGWFLYCRNDRLEYDLW